MEQKIQDFKDFVESEIKVFKDNLDLIEFNPQYLSKFEVDIRTAGEKLSLSVVKYISELKLSAKMSDKTYFGSHFYNDDYFIKYEIMKLLVGYEQQLNKIREDYENKLSKNISSVLSSPHIYL